MRLASTSFWKFTLLLVTMSIFPQQSQAQVELRYKFESGQKIDYLMKQTMTMVMNFQGMNITTKMDQTVDMTWHVGPVEKNGNATVKQKFNNVQFVMDAPTGKIVFDSKTGEEPTGQVGKILAPIFKAMVGAEFTTKMDSQGNITDVEIPEEFLKEMQKFPGGGGFGGLFSKEGFKQMMTKSGLVLPKTKVKSGDTWKQNVVMDSPIGKMEISTVFSYKGNENVEGKALEKIAVQPKVVLNADPNAPVQATLKSQKISGTSYFDSKLGQLASVAMTQTMEMEINAGGMVINQNLQQEVTLQRK